MANPNKEPLVTKMGIDDLFSANTDVRDEHSQAAGDRPGVLVTRMSVDDFVGSTLADPEERARVLYEIASQG